MSASPTSPERLEIRAFQQRERIHRTALELISKVDQAKQQLSPAHNVRKRFAAVSLIAAAVAFLSGYSVAAVFTER